MQLLELLEGNVGIGGTILNNRAPMEPIKGYQESVKCEWEADCQT